MAKHHIYIKESVEKKLAVTAKKTGTTTRDLIRAHIENLSVGVEMDAVQKDLKSCLDELARLTKCMEAFAQEIGFSSGVLRSKSAKDPEALAAGNAEGRRLRAWVATSLIATQSRAQETIL